MDGSISSDSWIVPPNFVGFLFGLFFDLEDGGDIFARNVGLSLNYPMV
jgi:hypothetical protein